MTSQNPKTRKTISVSIVEDNAKLLKALTILIDSAPDLHVRSAHATAEDALEKLPSAPPDIVLMDINLPGMSGIECVVELSRLLPQVRIVMLTAFENSDDIFASLSAGAYGYLLKSTEPEELLDSIREVAAGGSPISGSVARKIVNFFRTKPAQPECASIISPREAEVLKLLAAGCPYKQIADTMQVSMGTVRTFIERIYKKLHVHSRTEAVMKYFGR
jgi:DNA-binding NarL/FixJ family response regulator